MFSHESAASSIMVRPPPPLFLPCQRFLRRREDNRACYTRAAAQITDCGCRAASAGAAGGSRPSRHDNRGADPAGTIPVQQDLPLACRTIPLSPTTPLSIALVVVAVGYGFLFQKRLVHRGKHGVFVSYDFSLARDGAAGASPSWWSARTFVDCCEPRAACTLPHQCEATCCTIVGHEHRRRSRQVLPRTSPPSQCCPSVSC